MWPAGQVGDPARSVIYYVNHPDINSHHSAPWGVSCHVCSSRDTILVKLDQDAGAGDG